MDPAHLPSSVARQIATALDDNLLIPIPTLLGFETALLSNPGDETTRLVYRDWLLEHGCTRRAAELDRDWTAPPPEYTGPVRPESVYDWAGL